MIYSHLIKDSELSSINKTYLEELYSNEDINYIYHNCKWTETLSDWKRIKEESIIKYWLNTVIFYQVGTFFESYFHDAHLTSHIVWQILTSKNKSDPLSAPMSWSPVPKYLERVDKLLKAWYTVVIVEETWEQDKKKGFTRQITDIFTPWTNLDIKHNFENYYLYSLYYDDKTLWVSIVDITTNEFNVYSHLTERENLTQILEELVNLYPPKEIICNDLLLETYWYTYLKQKWYKVFKRELLNNLNEKIDDYFWMNTYNTLKNNDEHSLLYSIWMTLSYLEDIYQDTLKIYLNTFTYINPKDYFLLPSLTNKSLEVLKNINWYQNNSLFDIINRTKTPFGRRKLRHDLIKPLKNISLINERLDALSYLREQKSLIKALSSLFDKLSDLERISSKLVSPKITPSEILELANNLEIVGDIKTLISTTENSYIYNIWYNLKYFNSIITWIRNTLKEEGWISSKEGNIIKEDVNPRLKELIQLTDYHDKYYKDLETKLKEETWYSYLKVSETPLAWVYIEIKRGNEPLEWWRRVKSLKEYDRYDTQELVDYYYSSLTALQERNKLEESIYQSLRLTLVKYISHFHDATKELAKLDVLLSHTLTSLSNNYVKPEINDSKDIYIEEWRHPIIEKVRSFIPNTLSLTKESSLHIISWANMWGKSTYLRQTALIVLLSQIGSYIPCKRWIIGIVDNIFTRVWASDNITEWQSTFYIEMLEAWYMINKATDKTLLIFDELWRWTSTEDWEALSKAICEYLSRKEIRTLFATHYHNLNYLEDRYQNIESFYVETESKNKKIHFTHRIIKGKSFNSHGIEIAELAWLNWDILNIAYEIRTKQKDH